VEKKTTMSRSWLSCSYRDVITMLSHSMMSAVLNSEFIARDTALPWRDRSPFVVPFTLPARLSTSTTHRRVRKSSLDVQKSSREPCATRNFASGTVHRPSSFATPLFEQEREHDCEDSDEEIHTNG
jgi:hypothetical protein